MFYEYSIFSKNLARFVWKTLRQNFFDNKVSGLQPIAGKLINKDALAVMLSSEFGEVF